MEAEAGVMLLQAKECQRLPLSLAAAMGVGGRYTT
jgi:hypothetical protein